MWGKALTVAVCPEAMMQGTLCRRGGRQGTPDGERNHGEAYVYVISAYKVGSLWIREFQRAIAALGLGLMYC